MVSTILYFTYSPTALLHTLHEFMKISKYVQLILTNAWSTNFNEFTNPCPLSLTPVTGMYIG